MSMASNIMPTIYLNDLLRDDFNGDSISSRSGSTFPHASEASPRQKKNKESEEEESLLKKA